MAKFFETSDYLKELVDRKYDETNLEIYGVTVKVMSAKKMKDLIKVVKANPAVEHLTHQENIVMLQIYEEAIEKLEEEDILKIIDMALSDVWYDTEKDKLNVENNFAKSIFRMRQKYGDIFMNVLEAGYVAIDQIAEEAKEKKD